MDSSTPRCCWLTAFIYQIQVVRPVFQNMGLATKVHARLGHDLVPLVVTNAINTNEIVINKQVDGGHKMHIVPPSTSTRIRYITLYKTGENLDPYLPKYSARVESALKSSLNHAPLAESSPGKTGVKVGHNQSSQRRFTFIQYGHCNISNDNHDISTDSPRDTFLHFLCIHSYLYGCNHEQDSHDMNRCLKLHPQLYRRHRWKASTISVWLVYCRPSLHYRL